MAVTIIKKGPKGKPVTKVLQPKPPAESLIDKYKLKVGDVLLDAKGENKGVLVRALDRLTDEVVVQDIDTQGKYGLRKIGAHQCAMVDYYPIEPPYEGWLLRVVKGRAAAAKAKSS